MNVGEQVIGGSYAVVEQDQVEDDCGGVDRISGVIAPRTEVVAVVVGFVEEANCATGGGEACIDIGAEIKGLLNDGCSYERSVQQDFGILISCKIDQLATAYYA